MRASFLTLAAAALLLAGCSKEEITENVSDGVSALATPTSGQKNGGGNFHVWTEVWFNQNTGRMFLKLPGNGHTLTDVTANVRSYAISGQEDPNSGNLVDADGDGVFDYQEWNVELGRVGNSRIYRSGQDEFVFGTTTYFSLVDVTLTANTFIDDWQGETAYMQLFVYPSGRAVEQDPKVVRLRTRSLTNFDSAHEMTVIIADDPAQQVATSKLIAGKDVVPLEQSHFNQTLGLSRWSGFIDLDISGAGSGSGLSLLLSSTDDYGVDFLDAESNKKIVAKYDLSGNEDGTMTNMLSDEPVILGSRLGSTSFGEQWQLEIAIADLGEWVETVNYVFEPGEGPAPLVSELPMELTRTEGNLRVYTSPKFSFNGNPTGFNYGGIVYQFGTGTRSTAGNANNKAELL